MFGGSEVEHAVALGDEPVDQRRIHDAALEEAEPRVQLERREVLEATCGQVVQCPDLMSSLEQFFGEMGPDEAGTSCDQDPHSSPREADNGDLLPRCDTRP